MTVAKPGKGTILKLAGRIVAYHVTLDGPSIKVGTIETTVPGSPEKTYCPIIIDDELSGTLYFDPQTVTHVRFKELLTIVPPPTAKWKLCFADRDLSVYSFAGILTKLEPSNKKWADNWIDDGLLGADFAIKLVGTIAYKTAKERV